MEFAALPYAPAVPVPLVIAHRGACGYRPELTRAALELAIEQGATAIEIDVVATSDGVLVLRHDAELSDTTDVADRPDLADRRRTKRVAGRRLQGWFAEDLTAGEVASLRARERMPRLRPASAAFDGEQAPATLAEALAITAAAGTTLVVELKHPSRSAPLGLPLEQLLEDELRRAPALPPIVVECFEPAALETLRDRAFPHPMVALVGERLIGDARRLADPAAFDDYAGVSIRVGLVEPRRVAAFRERGADVWTWTLRPENRYLPRRHRAPGHVFGDYAAHWRGLAEAGVTGVFADHPDLALAVFGAPEAVGGPV